MARLGEEHKSLGYQIKQQLNDIVEIAYKDEPQNQRNQFKRFTVKCYDSDMKTKLGDCHWDRDKKVSTLRVFRLQAASFRSVVKTSIHELAHHVDFSKRGTSGHDASFYGEYKRLLFAALDMGILTKEYMLNSDSESRDVNKVANMVRSYVPHPVSYKQNTVQLFVTNAYNFREMLKARNYHWNRIEAAWYVELEKSAVENEKAFLYTLGATEENIRIVESNAVITRLGKAVFVTGIAYDNRDVPKRLGYRWDKQRTCWTKSITTQDIPLDEQEALEEVGGEIDIR